MAVMTSFFTPPSFFSFSSSFVNRAVLGFLHISSWGTLPVVHAWSEVPVFHREAPCVSEYQSFVSAPDAFVRSDVRPGLPGLHVLCLWEDSEEVGGVPSSSAPSSSSDNIHDAAALRETRSSNLYLEVFPDGVGDLRAYGRKEINLTDDADDPTAGGGGQKQTGQKLPLRFRFDDVEAAFLLNKPGHQSTGLERQKYFRAFLVNLLGIEKRSNNWGWWQYKQPFGLFNAQGHRLKDAPQALQAKFFLLFEGGQFMWPPVRKGFKRAVPVDMATPFSELFFEGRNYTFTRTEKSDGVTQKKNIPQLEEDISNDTVQQLQGGAAEQTNVVSKEKKTGSSEQVQDIVLETLSVQPIVYRIRGFLQERECDAIVDMGRPHMVSSGILANDYDTEQGVAPKEYRTSTQARLDKNANPLLTTIAQRIANLTKVPVEHYEAAQILRYQKTQFYAAHLDQADPLVYENQPEILAEWQHGHRNRLATVFWYLRGVKEGGETSFPRTEGRPQPSDYQDCSQFPLLVKPEKGAVLLWYSLHPNGNSDPNALHGACAVKGDEEKWAANYWIWNKPNDPATEMDAASTAMPDDAADEEYQNVPVGVLRERYRQQKARGTFSAKDGAVPDGPAHTLVTIRNPRGRSVDVSFRQHGASERNDEYLLPVQGLGETQLTTYLNHTFVFRDSRTKKWLAEHTIVAENSVAVVPVEDVVEEMQHLADGNGRKIPREEDRFGVSGSVVDEGPLAKNRTSGQVSSSARSSAADKEDDRVLENVEVDFLGNAVKGVGLMASKVD